MADAGMIVIASFISPFLEDREAARKIIGEKNFVEVFVYCPLKVCERDQKDFYEKARRTYPEFTGITSPYQNPENPEITIHSDSHSPAENLAQIIAVVDEKMKINEYSTVAVK